MSDQYIQTLIPRIRAILEGSDLSTVSAKAVRKHLISQGEDEATIKASRGKIDEEISTIYDELTSAQPPLSASHESIQPKAEPGSSQPQPLQTSTSVKREREDKPSISEELEEDETDEQMARRLQSEFDDQENSNNTPRPRRTNASNTPAKKKRKTIKKKVGNGDEDGNEAPKKKRKVNPDNPFNKEMILSDALADLVSAPRLSRPQVVKQIWAYVKERGFQDESDKRYILCDEKLKKVFHTDRLHMFTMNKILVDHLRNPDDVIIKDESKPIIKNEISQSTQPNSSATVTVPAIPPARDYSDSDSEDEDDVIY